MKKLLNIIFGKMTITVLLIIIQIILLGAMFTNLLEYNKWFSVFFSVLAIIMFFVVILSEQNPAYKIGWIVLIGVFPIFGGLLYFIMSDKKPSKRLRKKISDAEKELCKQIKDLNLDKLSPNIDKRTKSITEYISKNGPFYIQENTDVKYFELGEYMYSSMLEDLKKAEKFIFFEYFIVGEGKMWSYIRQILIQKAKQGVDVRVMYDDLGCTGVLPNNFVRDLEDNNIKVVTFNPLVPFLSLVMNNRNHRKILVIDGNVGYTGGINIADEYINEIVKHGHWKDTGIRLEGTGVLNLTVMFLSIWNAYIPEDNFDISKYIPTIKVENSFGYVQPFSDSPLDNETVSENLYMDILWQAKDYVYIFSPYLIIDNEMTVALTMAAKRGVDVRIVIPKIPDKKTVYHLAQSYFKPLIKGGVKIYLYTPGFIHAKSYVSDDKIGVVGTINMDYRSLYLHFECGALLIDNDVIFDLKNDCLKTFEISEEVTMDKIPKGLFFSIYQAILRILSPLF